VPARSVAELVKLARSHPGQLQYGSSGNGGSTHLAGEMFKHAACIDIVHVPFKGSAPALADTLAGQISMMFDTIVTTMPQLKAGKVRALAVTGEKRAPQTSDIPTLAEGGYKDTKSLHGNRYSARGHAARHYRPAYMKPRQGSKRGT